MAADPPADLWSMRMCSAVRIVVAAADRERRLELRRAAVTAEWEVVGEAADANAAYVEAVERRARFLVLDASAAGPRPEALVRRLRSTSPNAFVVGVGEVAGGRRHRRHRRPRRPARRHARPAPPERRPPARLTAPEGCPRGPWREVAYRATVWRVR